METRLVLRPNHDVAAWQFNTMPPYDDEYAFKPRFQAKKAPTKPRLLLVDHFKAYEKPEFIWYCRTFDVIPFRLPSNTTHMTQPLDVDVYQYPRM